jgi:serine/threonine protein kinase
MAATDAGALGKYRLIAELGRGGMADVYLALVSGPAGFNKLIVVKRIREQLADDPDFLSMFLDEARLAARLNHPNVVQTNEVGGDGKQLFIAMEYLEGQGLNRVSSRLGRDGSLTWAMHLRILIEVLAGLHYAHELCDFDGTKLHVVHRDVTPHNVFVSYSGQVKVVDFGIAKALGSVETRAGMLKGKASYMAPEQALGEAVDRRADIFSVGVMIWEALVGRKLFREDNDIANLQKIVNGIIPNPRAEKPEVPAEIADICLKALARRPEQRYATAAELQAALEAALEAAGERPSLRDVGRLVAEHFERERAQINALVESQIGAVRASGEWHSTHVSLAQLDESLLRKLPVLHVLISDAAPAPVEAPTRRMPALPGTSPLASEIESPPTMGPQAWGSTSTAPIVHLPPSPPRSLPSPLPNASERPRWFVGFAAAAALGAMLAWLNVRPEKPPPRPSAVAESRSHSARLLHLESTPPGASVSDGERLLGKTPLTLPLDPAEPSDRRLLIELVGYAPVSLEQGSLRTRSGAALAGPDQEDIRVVVPLVRSESADALPLSPAPPPPPSATTAEPTGSGHRKGGRPKPMPAEPPLPINMSR